MTASSQPVSIQKHPGKRRRGSRFTTKGRQVDATARDEIAALLGDREIRRDHLIEYLHLVQDQFGHLSARHVAALAEAMRLAQTEVYEVASFYAHFDLVRDDETPPPPLTIRVCDSLSCEMAGAKQLLANLPAAVGDQVRVINAPCMGRCHTAPVAEVGHHHVDRATVENLAAAAASGETHPVIPDYQDLDAYQADGGYSLLKACYAGEHTPEDLIERLLNANLRGLGGAGFPTGRKWGFVRGYEGPRLMAVNADEGEPGTFKDRHYLETEPHRFIEGMLIAAWVVDAETVFIYLRDEYPFVRELLTTELDKARAAGLFGEREVELRRGAGAYICGEESSMINRSKANAASTPSPTLCSRGGHIWSPDTRTECGNAVLDSRDRRERCGMVYQSWPQRRQRLAQLFRIGARERTRRQTRTGRRHNPGTDRRILWRHG